MRASSAVLVAVMVLWAAPAQADGPFGISMGTPKNDLRITIDMEDGAYIVEPPQAHPAFESYIVQLTEETGVCAVIALGKKNENDRYGLKSKIEHGKLEKSLTKKYGIFKSIDGVKADAMWGGDGEWVMAILQNERLLVTEWSNEYGSTLTDSIVEIILNIYAIDNFTSYAGLRYRFSNFDKCDSIKKGKSDDAL